MKHALPLQKLCDAAIKAAGEAGAYVQSVDRSHLRKQFKKAGSSNASQVVTDVDIRSEAIIRAHLHSLSDQWGIAFVGEESASSNSAATAARLRRPYFWCVDPLDGTLPFVEGKEGYAVSIALVAQTAEPLVGVVYDPDGATVLHSIQGQGVYRDSWTFNRTRKAPETLVVFADTSFKTHVNYNVAVDSLHACAQSLNLSEVQFVYGSGAVKNACQVLDYANACYLKLPKPEEGGGSLWDFAATACIVSEAGAWVSNMFGNPLDLNRRDSTFMNHQGVLFASHERLARSLLQSFQQAL